MRIGLIDVVSHRFPNLAHVVRFIENTKRRQDG